MLKNHIKINIFERGGVKNIDQLRELCGVENDNIEVERIKTVINKLKYGITS